MAKCMSKVLLLSLVCMFFFVSSSFAASKNVAPEATITASSFFNDDNHFNNVADGKKKEHGVGEWASLGEVSPWIKLEWSTAVTINKIVVYDRPNDADNVNGGTFTFSDGSTVDLFDIKPAGEAAEITFDAKTVTSVQFNLLGGAGFNVGLLEMEVFTADVAAVDKAVEAPAPVDNPKTGDSGVLSYMIAALLAMTVVTVMLVRKRFSKSS